MKTKKILGFVLLTGVFLLLASTTVLASKEVVVESITCPSTIVIGKWKWTGNKYEFIGTETLKFEEEYLKGVVPHEISPSFSAEALKAQAVAARTFAMKLIERHKNPGKIKIWDLDYKKYQIYDDPGGYDLCNTTHCQVWKNEPEPSTDVAVDATKGEVIRYRNSPITAAFFSSTKYQAGHRYYTKNSEEAPGFGGNYCEYLRKTISPEGPVGIGGHGAGMSQYGAKVLAENGVSYENILKHYYGPVPPYVKKVIVTQNNLEYEAEWIDQNDYPNPTRRLDKLKNDKFNFNNIKIIIEFSELVNKKEIEVSIGNQKAKLLEYKEDTYKKLLVQAEFELTKEQVKELGSGVFEIKIEAAHKFVNEWRLDAKPETFCYQNHNANADKLVNYEQGLDINHKIEIVGDIMVTIEPIYHFFQPNQSKQHNIIIENKGDFPVVVKISKECIKSSTCLFIPKDKDHEISLKILKNKKGETSFTVEANNLLKPDDTLIYKFKVIAEIIIVDNNGNEKTQSISDEEIFYLNGRTTIDYPCFIDTKINNSNYWPETQININKYDCQDNFLGTEIKKELGGASFEWEGIPDCLHKYFSYSYKLFPVHDWTTSKKETSISYKNLNSGSYCFEVKADDKCGNVDPTPAVINFTIKKEEINLTVKNVNCTPKEVITCDKIITFIYEYDCQDNLIRITTSTTPGQVSLNWGENFNNENKNKTKSKLTYSYQLFSVDNNWTEFSEKTFVNYNNLNSESYNFTVIPF